MKKLLLLSTLSMIVLIGSGYKTASGIAQDIRNLDPFDGIGISVSADVFYTQGNSHEVKIEGAEKDVQALITKVTDGFLQVKYVRGKMKRSKLTIYITSKELEAVKISGSDHCDPSTGIQLDDG